MELKIKVDVQGALLKGKALEVVQKNLDQAITRATILLHNEVLKRTPQGASGSKYGLMNSIKGDVVLKGTPMVKGIVATAQKYGEVIEKGRQPGKGIAKEARPVLIKWVNEKLKIEGKQAERVAFLISRKIKKYGFEGRHMFENALNDNMGVLDDIFKKVGFDISKELSE